MLNIMKFCRTTALAFLAAGSFLPSAAASPDAMSLKFPDVVDVKVRASGTDRFDFDATISSPYDTPKRYADAFRVLDRDGRVFGERILQHDHANEQPFTRDLYGISIPHGLRTVVIQARDLKYGYGGKTFEIALPGR